MAEVKPYSESGSKKEQVEKMFDNISGYYDFLNHFLSMGIDKGWRRKVVKMMAEKNPSKIMDMATGTADLAIAQSVQFPHAEIVGLDLSSQMLAVGQKKLDKKNIKNVTLTQADSEKIPFADNTFDAISVAFGVRNFENLSLGISEMVRTLKPGGSLYILEFSKPKTFPFKQIFNAYFKYLLPLIGKLTSKDPRAYQYLYESVQLFPEGDAFQKVAEGAGLKEVKAISLTLGVASIYYGTK